MEHRTSMLEVKEFPRVVSAPQALRFLGEMQSHVPSERPQIVLDCSKMNLMDESTMQLLLDCLEEAIKRNGDVRLAAVPTAARATLKLTGVDRIFEIFDTNAEAVNSFRRFPVNTV